MDLLDPFEFELYLPDDEPKRPRDPEPKPDLDSNRERERNDDAPKARDGWEERDTGEDARRGGR